MSIWAAVPLIAACAVCWQSCTNTSLFSDVHSMKLLMLLMAFPAASQEMILADFPSGMPQAGGWKWEYFSDRVMGGRSDLIPPAAPISCTCETRARTRAPKILWK